MKSRIRHPRVLPLPIRAIGQHINVNAVILCLSVGLVLLCGCTPQPEFRFNAVELEVQKIKLFDDENDNSEQTFPAHYRSDIANLVTAFFGTPNEPSLPVLEGEDDAIHTLIDQENLRISAGPVSSERDGAHLGLYREHCAQCHGISGDGRGPTSGFLNPYPRDFRMGRFKFKSSKGRAPPSDADLRHVIVEGIPGTAMPSFKLLKDEEVEALIDYVTYLSIRGQFERELIQLAGDFYDERLIKWTPDQYIGTEEQDEPQTLGEQVQYFADEIYKGILKSWLRAGTAASEVPTRPVSFPNNRLLIAQGKKLFLGKANCGQCHGATGLGDGQTENYDLWTLSWLETPGVDPSRPSTYSNFIRAGAFPPRKMKPRNLRLRVFRGGNSPEDVYRRIANGIDGTPMPAASALEPNEIWALVAYLLNLPDEPLSGGQSSRVSPVLADDKSDSSGDFP